MPDHTEANPNDLYLDMARHPLRSTLFPYTSLFRSYFHIDSNVLNSGSVFGFHNGDFDYNGQINGDDYFILDSNILQVQGSGIIWPTGARVGGLASVPEPGMTGIVGVLAVAGSQRRKRRRLAR